MKRWFGSLLITTGVLTLAMAAQGALAQGALAGGASRRPAQQDGVLVQDAPDIAPSTPAPAPSAQPGFRIHKYDEALVDDMAVFNHVHQVEPKNFQNQADYNSQIANGQTDQVIYQYDYRAKYESKDALAVDMGLMDDDGTVNHNICKGLYYDAAGNLKNCDYFITVWYVPAGSKKPENLHDYVERVAGKKAASKVAYGLTYDEFKNAKGKLALNLDNWYKERFGLGYDRQDWRWMVTFGVAAVSIPVWRKLLKRWDRIEAEWTEAQKMGPVAAKEAKKLWGTSRFMRGWMNTFFVGSQREKEVELAGKFGKAARKIKTTVADLTMFSIGSGLYLCTLGGANMSCGLLGVSWLPTPIEKLMKWLVDSGANDDIKKAFYIYKTIDDGNCAAAQLRPNVANDSCGQSEALQREAKLTEGAAMAQSSQDEAVPDTQLENDDGAYNDGTMREVAKKELAAREEAQHALDRQLWIKQNEVDYHEVLPRKIAPEIMKNSLDYELDAAEMYMSLSQKRASARAPAVFEGAVLSGRQQ